MTVAHWFHALLCNGLGQYEEALTAAQVAAKHQEEFAAPRWGLVELVEAAARSGTTELGTDALERLSAVTRASGTDWALGVEARSRALVATARLRSGSTVRRSSGSIGPVSAWSLPARTSYTASGCGVSSAGWTRAITCARPTRCSVTWGSRGSPSAPVASSWPPAGPRADARRKPAACSYLKKRRSRSWRGRVFPIRRSARGCSSAPDGAIPPAEGLLEARHHLAQPAQPRSRQPPHRGIAVPASAGRGRRSRSVRRARDRLELATFAPASRLTRAER